MKMDKTGACTVIAAIATVARLAPGTPLLAVAPAVENMPGPHSTRPGDVVRALNGKMVDITNTDAEGRLILGDAMTYAEQLGATHIVDVATLTGAVARALGHLVTGAFGRPQDFYDDVMAAGDRAGERYWQLPLVDDYVPEMESWYGDLQNSGAADGSLDQERPLPSRVRDEAVGPPRHRRDRLLPQGRCRSRRAGRPAPSHATLVELALAGATRTDQPPGTRSASVAGRARVKLADVDRCASWGAARRRRVRLGLRRRPVRDALARARRGASARPPASTGGPASRRRSSARSRSGCCRCGSPATRSRSSLFGAWFVTLVVGLATDLDQRLLPDVLTLPVIPVALLYAAERARTRSSATRCSAPAVAAAIVVPAVLYLPSIPFGAGAFGIGDVKLLVGVGLMSGASRALGGVVVGLRRWRASSMRGPARRRGGSACGRTSRSGRS